MGIQSQLILTAYMVHFALTYGHPHGQMVFSEVPSKVNDGSGDRENAFGAMQKELRKTRNRNVDEKINSYKKSNDNENIMVVKREVNVKSQGATTDSNLSHPTRWPYPHKPNETDWSVELKQRPFYHESGHREIDAIFTRLLNGLAQGDRKKKAQLTLHHEWYPIEASNCYDRMRELVTKQCVDWRWNPYAQKFGYILINMCNACWLTAADLEDAIAKACPTKSFVEDMEK